MGLTMSLNEMLAGGSLFGKRRFTLTQLTLALSSEKQPIACA